MEKKEKIIIVVLIVIIVALLVCLFAVMPNTTKQDTRITFNKNSTLTEGSSLIIKLTDLNKTAIANQSINISITDKNNTKSDYVVKTNDKGLGILKLDKIAGKYNITAVYGGNDNYTGCNATKNLTIKKEVKKTESVKSYPKYNPDLGYYRSTGIGQDEMGVVELESGRYVVIAGDGYYEYNGQDIQGNILRGSFLGHGGQRIY